MYRIVTHDEVVAQTSALPDHCFSYLQVLAVLELVPWNGEPYSEAKPDGAMRKLLFGPDGAGEVIYLILEYDRRVELLRVHWIG
jgi:hypothetical protein